MAKRNQAAALEMPLAGGAAKARTVDEMQVGPAGPTSPALLKLRTAIARVEQQNAAAARLGKLAPVAPKAPPGARPDPAPAPDTPASETARAVAPEQPAPPAPKVTITQTDPSPAVEAEAAPVEAERPLVEEPRADTQTPSADSPPTARVRREDPAPPSDPAAPRARSKQEQIAGASIKPPIDGRHGGGGGGGGGGFHKRLGPENSAARLAEGVKAVRRNLAIVMTLTVATNILVLSIPIYLFQISDRVLTSRSIDTLIMLTVVIAGAVILQSILDGVRRMMLMRTAVQIAAKLGGPILAAAAHASLHSNGREYQTLGDLQQIRSFLTGGTLLSFLDVPFTPLFIIMIFLVHPHLGLIVVGTALTLLVIALLNQRVTATPFGQANQAQSLANLHLDSMSRNSQVINALAMIPELVSIWGRDTARSLKAQVTAQDRNVMSAMLSRGVRLLTQVAMLGWGAYLAIQGEITGGMVIAASIIAGRALAPVEGAIEGWSGFLLSRNAYGRISSLLRGATARHEKLRLPDPRGRLDVERLLYVPGGTKQVILNGISFHLDPGDTLAVIGNSGAGKTTLGKMLVGSIMPTSGNVRLDLMDLRNWEPRQLGESIGYLPQDVQLFPGTIKENIGRMRSDADDADIYRAAVLADVHDMIASLPQGYETVVSVDGSPLSGGQKQRVGLARAFFGSPKLLVLDEPNSNLDAAGDKALFRAIEQAREQGITVVVITQKTSLLPAVQKIMMLADGNIAMFGHREEVLQRLHQFKQPKAKPIPGGSGAAPVPGDGGKPKGEDTK